MTKNSRELPDRPLFLLTAEWPYGTGENFLTDEIPFLLERFPNLLVLPMFASGSARATDPRVSMIPSGPPSDLRLLELLRGMAKSGGLLGKEWRQSPGFPFSPGTFYLTARTLGIARRIEKRILETARKHRFKRGIIYSYWMNQSCMGGILAAKKLGWPIVSRAHGGDLYLERHPKGYLPWHEWKVSHLDCLFPVSENGRNYLVQSYPKYKEKIRVQHLGVRKGEKRKNRVGDSDELHIVSCSTIIPLKRVDRIFETVHALHDRLIKEPSATFKTIRWTHFGDGPGLEDLKEKVRRTNKPGLEITLPGRVEPEFVTDFYVREEVDLFLNYSTSEGIPVSIMEAGSCGIPAAAPMTGGIPEIVTRETGIPFHVDDTPDTVAGMIKTALTDGALAAKGDEAYRLWSNRFDRDKNYRQFADFLASL